MGVFVKGWGRGDEYNPNRSYETLKELTKIPRKA